MSYQSYTWVLGFRVLLSNSILGSIEIRVNMSTKWVKFRRILVLTFLQVLKKCYENLFEFFKIYFEGLSKMEFFNRT